MVVDGYSSAPNGINAGLSQRCVLSATVFLQINDLLLIPGIFEYANDTVQW